MMKHLTALAHSTSGAVGQRSVYGQFPDTIDILALAEEVKDKPVLKKIEGQLLVLIPLQTGEGASGWTAWLFNHVPPVNELPSLIDSLRAFGSSLYTALEQSDDADAAATPKSSKTLEVQAIVLQCLQDMGNKSRLSKRKALQVLTDCLTQNGLARAVALVACTAKKSGYVSVSDQTLIGHADEFSRLAELYRTDAPSTEVFRASSQADEKLEGAMMVETLKAKNLVIHMPPKGKAGICFLLIDAIEDAETQLESLIALSNLTLGQKPDKREDQKKKRIWQGVMLAGATAAMTYLLMPTSLLITTSALSQPREALATNLTFDSYLQTMQVEVGDKVSQGDLVALMSAPNLEARRSEIALQMSVQELSAKAALGQNDYGTYQLSMQKIETQRVELEQVEQKLAQLSVSAPISGTIIQTLGRESLGRYVSTGQTLAIIQPDDLFAITLTFSGVDAPLVRPGQTGSVYFRGLSDKPYHFTVTTPVYVETNEQTQSQRLVAKANINEAGGDTLISGLSGFAQLNAGEDLRIFVLTRYITEYLKVKAWTYLGLHF